MIFCFVWFDTLRPSQQFFHHVQTRSGKFLKFLLVQHAICVCKFSNLHWKQSTFSCLLVLNQYYAEDKVFCSRTQRSAFGESQTSNPSILSLALYHWATALLIICFIWRPTFIINIIQTSNDGMLCNRRIMGSLIRHAN